MTKHKIIAAVMIVLCFAGTACAHSPEFLRPTPGQGGPMRPPAPTMRPPVRPDYRPDNPGPIRPGPMLGDIMPRPNMPPRPMGPGPDVMKRPPRTWNGPVPYYDDYRGRHHRDNDFGRDLAIAAGVVLLGTILGNISGQTY